MNDTAHPNGPAVAHTPGSAPRMHDASAPTVPGNERSQGTPAGVPEHDAPSAHNTVADSGAPAVRQPGEASDAWIQGVRCSVRNNPLLCMAAAFALGVIVARADR